MIIVLKHFKSHRDVRAVVSKYYYILSVRNSSE